MAARAGTRYREYAKSAKLPCGEAGTSNLRTPTDDISPRLREIPWNRRCTMQSRTFALVVAAALAVALLAPDGSQSIAASDVPQLAAAPDRSAAAPIDPARLVPVDVLGTGVVSWVPSIADGSN